MGVVVRSVAWNKQLGCENRPKVVRKACLILGGILPLLMSERDNDCQALIACHRPWWLQNVTLTHPTINTLLRTRNVAHIPKESCRSQKKEASCLRTTLETLCPRINHVQQHQQTHKASRRVRSAGKQQQLIPTNLTTTHKIIGLTLTMFVLLPFNRTTQNSTQSKLRRPKKK